MTTKWSELSPRTRQLIIGVGAADATLRVLALLDLAQRPASQVRGSKWAWAAAIGLLSSGGAVPIAYIVKGVERDKPKG